jgi:hypothetical protein
LEYAPPARGHVPTSKREEESESRTKQAMPGVATTRHALIVVFQSRVWTHFREMKIEPARETPVVFRNIPARTGKTRVNVKV